MIRMRELRPVVLVAGRMLLALLCLCFAHAAIPAAPEGADELILRADRIKTADNNAFLQLLKQIDARSDSLTPLQRDWLIYLKAWQAGLAGDFRTGESSLKGLLGRTEDPTLRARARITLLNHQALASHYEDAYTNLSELIESLPSLQDATARHFSYGVAALLYNQAGQYDLAIRYADLWLADTADETGPCKATSMKAESLYRIGKLQADDALARDGIEACRRIGDPLFANLIRINVGNVLVDHGRAADALQMLAPHDQEVMDTRSAATISSFRALLARCYFLEGAMDKAREFAQSAIDHGIKQSFSKPVADAYEVLYEIAKQQADYKSALAFHEKFAEASKGYLTDTTAHTLAYQMVNQQVLDKKRQIDALNDANQVLQLKQQVDAKSAEASRLYILLLIAVLGSIAWWAFRTKLSQLRFQKLARRDSLTGIFNRQHFLETATATLRYAAKSAREICLIVIDLDNFKTINDSYGHAVGDQVLKRAVAICARHMRSVDVFGRLGGEEFGVLLADCAPDQAALRAEELRAAIAGLGDDDIKCPVSASFGVAASRLSGYDLKQLLIEADAALYRAKRQGRNRVAMSDGDAANEAAHPLAG